MTTPTVALVGATASGKSSAAHRAALEAGRTEIVALDALTAYRGMDLGTAKPTYLERAEVRYHLLDVLDASEELSVRSYQALAAEAMAGIAARGHAALLVGGSGLYHRAVVDALRIPRTTRRCARRCSTRSRALAGAARSMRSSRRSTRSRRRGSSRATSGASCARSR